MTDTAEGGGFPAPRFQPGRLWSLFDVLKLYATSFLAIGEHLATVDVFMALNEAPSNVSESDELVTNPPDLEVTSDELEAWFVAAAEEERRAAALSNPVDALGQLVELAERLELPVSAELIRQNLARGHAIGLAEYRLLKQALYTEIKGKALLYIPRERASFYENETILTDRAKGAFGSAYAELREAGSCYAVGRNTATVLHCMRAAEVGVKAMARALGYRPDDLTQQDWHPVLLKCESIIEEMRNKMKKGPEKEAELAFYSQAAVQFRHFKDGYRVRAAHARAPFLEGEAKQILDATISFYETLASRLSEDAQEIAAAQSAP